MCFHHTDDCNEEDENMLERVAVSFFSEKQFWTDNEEYEIDYIEAYLYYDKDAEIDQYNRIIKYIENLKKIEILKYYKLNEEIATNIKVKKL